MTKRREEKQKLHMTYTVDGKFYVGRMTNHPAVILQAESLEELQNKARMAMVAWLEMNSAWLDQDEPFEMLMVSQEDFLDKCRTVAAVAKKPVYIEVKIATGSLNDARNLITAFQSQSFVHDGVIQEDQCIYWTFMHMNTGLVKEETDEEEHEQD
jgi:hypothetical protein